MIKNRFRNAVKRRVTKYITRMSDNLREQREILVWWWEETHEYKLLELQYQTLWVKINFLRGLIERTDDEKNALNFLCDNLWL